MAKYDPILAKYDLLSGAGIYRLPVADRNEGRYMSQHSEVLKQSLEQLAETELDITLPVYQRFEAVAPDAGDQLTSDLVEALVL